MSGANAPRQTLRDDGRPALCVSLFGIHDLLGDVTRAMDVVRLIDDLGIEQVNVTDHVVMGNRVDRYPFGTFPVPLDYPWYEPMTLLSWIAGGTDRVRLATGILISPLRSGVLLAKQAATLDVLSSGRLDLGVGVGWQPEEYEASGVDFDRRWAMLDEGLRTCRSLWAGSFTSIQVSGRVTEEIVSLPSPRQHRLPVWFGVAATPRQAARIAEFGDGWVPISRSPSQIAEGVDLIRAAFVSSGRASEELQVRAKAPHGQAGSRSERWQVLQEVYPRLKDAGVTVVDVALGEYVHDEAEISSFLHGLVKWRDSV